MSTKTTAEENLLEEFPPVSTEQWEQVIHKDLKGADYAKKLLWKTEDGLTIKPYYRREDLGGITFLDAAAGEFPYVRGNRASGGWKIREEIEARNPEEANRLAREALAAGAEEITFQNAPVTSRNDMVQLLDGMRDVSVHFSQATPQLLELIVECDAPANGSADFDPLTGLDFAEKLLSKLPASFRSFSVPMLALEEAGATAAQQLGYGIAAGVDYLNGVTSRGIGVARATAALSFSVGIESSYFLEIAKLRALRLLWSRVVESFGGKDSEARTAIFARTSRWNTTVYDPHVNVLRATTEAMSAALGGADAVTVARFDEPYSKPTEAGRRLARNTQIILKAEAQIARVADAGGGSYYLETITDQLARKAWEILQAVEAAGGFTHFKAEGRLQFELDKSQTARESAVAMRRRVLLGTNQYPNRKETALDRADLDRVFAVRRGARAYEELRLRTEQHMKQGGKNPLFLLAEIGDPRMRAARSGFAANFFGCAGFALATHRYQSAEAIADAEADLIVLCSSDAEYPAIVGQLMSALKGKGHDTPVVVAGNPESAEQLKAAGVVDFVHVRSNPIETLSRWQRHFHIGQS